MITLADGRQYRFLGSANESFSAWKLNYELLWEDDSAEAVAWVQEEFDALWGSADAPWTSPSSSSRTSSASPGARVMRERRGMGGDAGPGRARHRGAGLSARRSGSGSTRSTSSSSPSMPTGTPQGARFVLADQVGLGKTLQLAMAAQLMALTGSRPVLILAPKPLLWQWQDELSRPARHAIGGLGRARSGSTRTAWNTRPSAPSPCASARDAWASSPQGSWSAVPRWPTGWPICNSSASSLDEAHRARRRNLAPGKEFDAAEPNNLLRFLRAMSPRAKSVLLATATPVQLHPVEAWDLLEALARGSDAVLGSPGSRWRKRTARHWSC